MQEFILIENTISQGREDFQKMKAYLEKHDVENLVGAEGGFSPRNFTNTSVLETMTAVFPKGEFAIDVAGSFKQGEVDFDILLSTHNIKSLEDPFSDEEWGRWHEIRKKHGERVLIVGDDLTTTNPERLKLAIEEQAITGIVIKPNQNGTITGTLETIRLAKESGIKIIVSHRGEETDDDWIADFALFVEADFVKFGGMDRGERIAKYNRLLQLGMN